MTENSDGQYSKQETQRRFERLVKAALKTPPKTRESMGPKGMPSQSKKRQARKRKRAVKAA